MTEQQHETIERLATENRKVHDSNLKLAAEVRRLQADKLYLCQELVDMTASRNAERVKSKLYAKKKRGAK